MEACEQSIGFRSILSRLADALFSSEFRVSVRCAVVEPRAWQLWHVVANLCASSRCQGGTLGVHFSFQSSSSSPGGAVPARRQGALLPEDSMWSGREAGGGGATFVGLPGSVLKPLAGSSARLGRSLSRCHSRELSCELLRRSKESPCVRATRTARLPSCLVVQPR